MSKHRVVQICFSSIMLVTFLIATIVFFFDKNGIEKYTMDFASYSNVSEVQSFKTQIEKNLNMNFDNLYLKNGGEIIVDNEGNIDSLNIDCYFLKDELIYSVQIEKNDDCYSIISEKILDVEEKENRLIDYLNMISFWDFSKNDGNCNIIFSNELINGINRNDNIEKYLFDGKEILSINSRIEGLFLKTTFLLSGNSIDELYFQISNYKNI